MKNVMEVFHRSENQNFIDQSEKVNLTHFFFYHHIFSKKSMYAKNQSYTLKISMAYFQISKESIEF